MLVSGILELYGTFLRSLGVLLLVALVDVVLGVVFLRRTSSRYVGPRNARIYAGVMAGLTAVVVLIVLWMSVRSAMQPLFFS